MISTFTWLDYSEHERRQFDEIIKGFNEKDTRDELGLGSVRDAFAEMLFPGISTIQTRAKYFFLLKAGWKKCSLYQHKRNQCDRDKQPKQERPGPGEAPGGFLVHLGTGFFNAPGEQAEGNGRQKVRQPELATEKQADRLDVAPDIAEGVNKDQQDQCQATQQKTRHKLARRRIRRLDLIEEQTQIKEEHREKQQHENKRNGLPPDGPSHRRDR